MEAARDQTSKFVTKNYTTLTHVSNFWHNAKLNKIQGRIYRKSQPQLLVAGRVLRFNFEMNSGRCPITTSTY
jgi:hypothetical protein